jgi:hypothetical protein
MTYKYVKKVSKEAKKTWFPLSILLNWKAELLPLCFFLKKPTRHSGYNLNNASNIVRQCSKTKKQKTKKKL